MLLHHLFGDGQARAGAAVVLVLGVEALEELEDAGLVPGFDADAVVAHVKSVGLAAGHGPRGAGRCFGRGQPHRHGFGGLVVILHAVDNQVVEHLLQPHPVGAHRGQRPHHREHGVGLLEARLQQLGHLGQYLVQVHVGHHQVGAAHARELQQRLNQAFHALAQAHQRFELVHALGVEAVGVVFQQKQRVVVDAAQGLLQVVRGHVSERVQLVVAALQLVVEAGQALGAGLQLVEYLEAQVGNMQADFPGRGYFHGFPRRGGVFHQLLPGLKRLPGREEHPPVGEHFSLFLLAGPGHGAHQLGPEPEQVVAGRVGEGGGDEAAGCGPQRRPRRVEGSVGVGAEDVRLGVGLQPRYQLPNLGRGGRCAHRH